MAESVRFERDVVPDAALVGAIGAPLFETEDLRGAVETFPAEGPRKATFQGR